MIRVHDRTEKSTSGTNRARSRRAAVVLLAVAMFTSTIGVALPAVAVPATVPSVNLVADPGENIRSYNYGVQAPSPRRMLISAETRTLRLTMPFFQVAAIDCEFRNAAGAVLSTSRTYRPDTEDQPHRGLIELPVPAGAVIPGTAATYVAECVDDEAKSTFTFVEGAGQGAAVTQPIDLEAQLVSSAYFVNYAYSYDASIHVDQTLVPGNRVRVYGPVGAFAQPNHLNKFTISLTVGSQTRSGLDAPANPDGSILGFTVPAGLPAGRVDIAVKTVASIAGTATTPKYDSVARYSNYGIYDPNSDGRTIAVTSSPSVAKTQEYRVFTATAGAFSPTPGSVSIQWLCDGQPVPGKTSRVVRLDDNTACGRISILVTASKPGYRPVARVAVSLFTNP